MFVGHFGVGLAGKAVTPRVSLAVWFAAVQLVDLLWPPFLLLGWEHVRVTPGITRLTPLDFYDYPLSHSLVGGTCWAALFGLGAYFRFARRGRGVGRNSPHARRDALLLAGGVLSHWVLDAVVHRPDMPVLPHGPYVGLGMWNHPVAEIALEAAIFLGGAACYLRATRAVDRIGRYGIWLLSLFLLAGWLASILAPPPPDVRSLAWTSIGLFGLILLWAWWVDRHRLPRQTAVAL